MEILLVWFIFLGNGLSFLNNDLENVNQWEFITSTSSKGEVSISFNENNYKELLIIAVKAEIVAQSSLLVPIKTYQSEKWICVQIKDYTSGYIKRISNTQAVICVNSANTYLDTLQIYAR